MLPIIGAMSNISPIFAHPRMACVKWPGWGYLGTAARLNRPGLLPREDFTVNLDHLLDLLWFRVWWRHPQPTDPWFSIPYHVFNLFEGICWIVFACLVLLRYLRFRHSAIELLYSLAFCSFALTDFREAFVLESWLVWVKLANLIALVGLRSFVMRRFYPDRKLF
jgi:hypothetical protein